MRDRRKVWEHPGITPAQHMRAVLAELRLRGVPFEEAWRSAIRTLPKGTCADSKKYIAGWKAVLRWAKPAFQSAYEDWSVNEVEQNDQDHQDQEDSQQDLHHGVA